MVNLRRMPTSRMKLADVVEFFANKNLNQTALYFVGCANDNITVDGWIDARFVQQHVGEGMLLRELQSEVTTAVFA